MEVSIRRPDDFHVHFRDGAMLRAVVPHTARPFGRALVMPNVPPIEDGRAADALRHEIRSVSPRDDFTPLMTIKLTHRTTRAVIVDAIHRGVVAAKLYPEGATTGSHDGIRDVGALVPVLEAMQDLGMVLCIHGEEPSAFVLDRERAYLAAVACIVRNFPGLRVVLEHITTFNSARFVADSSVNVAATITAHHLQITLDDVLGSGLRPHHFCYPVAKRPEDRAALVDAAIADVTGRFFFGSDSAPHARSAKESACGCAGVYSAPVALAVLAEVFFGRPGDVPAVGDLERRRASLERFAAHNGAKFYRLTPNVGTVTLADEPWVVPAEIDGVVPFRAGETLGWRVVEDRP
jgi:dihydroorotase